MRYNLSAYYKYEQELYISGRYILYMNGLCHFELNNFDEELHS